MFDDDQYADQHDQELARELLGIFSEDFPEPPDELPARTIRKIEAEMTSRDLLDLTTFVFLMSFCAPILDLFAAFFGHEPMRGSRTRESSSTRSHTRPSSANASSAPSVTSDNDLLSSDETNRDSHDD